MCLLLGLLFYTSCFFVWCCGAFGWLCLALVVSLVWCFWGIWVCLLMYLVFALGTSGLD